MIVIFVLLVVAAFCVCGWYWREQIALQQLLDKWEKENRG